MDVAPTGLELFCAIVRRASPYAIAVALSGLFDCLQLGFTYVEEEKTENG
jgi:hypothetical protein